jgi:hypothetical protein
MGFALTVGALTVLGPAQAQNRADNRAIAALRAKERKSFTDAQILDGFFKLALGAELRLAGQSDRIRKYDRPVRVYVDNRVEARPGGSARVDRTAQVAAVVADIGSKVAHLDIAMTDARDAAQVIVTLVRDRDLMPTLRKMYGATRAKRIERSLKPQCLSSFSKDDSYRILRSDVVVVGDAGDFIFYDCIYEELLQSLGPINDDASVPWTMFNDDVQKGFFDVYDQYILNLLYDPRVKPGMTGPQVRAVLPEVLETVREHVAKTNGLKP